MYGHSVLFRGIVAAGAMILLSAAGPLLGQTTTFYVARHAEKAGNNGDVGLTREGYRRADELREVLGSVPLSQIYVSEALRTQLTAAPTAAHHGLEPVPYGQPGAAKDWPLKHNGGAVLVVSHSGEVEAIVEALSGQKPEKVGNQYDNLFIVTIRDGQRSVERRKYGLVVAGDEAVRFEGEPDEGEDLSAVEVLGDNLVVASDETRSIQVLERTNQPTVYRVGEAIGLLKDAGGDEIDIEGLARDDKFLYVIGSHSSTRKRVDRLEDVDRKYAKNRERIAETNERPDRNHLIRLSVDAQSGEIDGEDAQSIDLRDLLKEEDVLGPFGGVPGKENGLDVEGLAVSGDWVYAGLRGPVLQGNFTPVVKLRFEKPHKPELLFVQVGGRGVRSLASVAEGFLVVAGPTGDAPLSYQLYHWDGQDMIPGKGAPDGRATLLGTIPAPEASKAEGLAVLEETADEYRVLVLYDGPKGGSPRVLQVRKP